MSRRVQPGTLKFIVIAAVMMLLADQFIFGGKRSYIEQAKLEKAQTEQLAAQKPLPPPIRVEPPDGKEYFEAPPEAVPPPMMEDKETAKAPDTRVPIFPKRVDGPAKIAIIIDDIGMDIRRSREAIDLPASVTLAFLPYAPRTRELAAEAKAKGHELIIHTPMEASDGSVNIGPGGLKAGMGAAEFEAAFNTMTQSFDGYVGINNHMGSRLTQDKDAMKFLMSMLAQKKLFFVDSKTSGKSVAADMAMEAGVPNASRDIFLDHEDTLSFVEGALKKTERLALKRGSAIAIGHPKDNTIAGLKAWIPTLKEKGIEIVPVSELLNE